MTLAYDAIGNIINQTYANAKAKTLQGILSFETRPVYAYNFTYDNTNRLLSGVLKNSNTQVFALTGMSYDDNGNIKTLNRQYSPTQNIDQLVYNYANINRLDAINDQEGTATTANKGFFDANNANYTYDQNGNLKTDSGKGISNISYDYRNLPNSVVMNGKTYTYTYASDGKKLQANFGTNKKYDYIGGGVWKNDTLEFVPTAEGRAILDKKNRWQYEYALRDHLQDTRLTCACNPDSGLVVLQENHFDPWGVDLATLGISGNNRFKYINREDQEDLGWIDLMQRMYDPRKGRFDSIDPKPDVAGQESLTTYQYGWNNPINKSDPNGDCPECVDETAKVMAEWGNDFQKSLKEIPTDILSYTDFNDASVLVTSVTRGGNGINIDGTKANGVDKGFAMLGLLVPAVSGSGLKHGIEYIGKITKVEFGAYKDLVKAKLKDAHHVIQDAAARGIDTYKKGNGPSVKLEGPSNVLGTPHYKATQVQKERRRLGDGGTYGSERRIGYRALRAAGLSIEDAKEIMRKTDDFFKNLGVSQDTPTRKPNSRN